MTTSRTHIFKGRHERFGHHKSRGAFRNLRPYLWVNHFQGLESLTKKRQLFPRLVTTSVSLFLLPVPALPRGQQPAPLPSLGLLTQFPFAKGVPEQAGGSHQLPFREASHTPSSPRFRFWLRAD